MLLEFMAKIGKYRNSIYVFKVSYSDERFLIHVRNGLNT